jgi:hypothetical protein
MEPPVVAHIGLAPVQAPAPAAWQPVQAFLTQNALAGSVVQLVLSLHSTHRFVVGLHTPVPASPWQSALLAHSTHAPVSDLHTGRAGFLFMQASADSPCAAQPTQLLWLPQMGLAGSLQLAWVRHPTHCLVVKSQNPEDTPPSTPPSVPPSVPASEAPALPAQLSLLKHPTHLPLDESHTGARLFLVRHSLVADEHASHWLATHTGFAGSAVQSLLFAHATQRPLVVSQTFAPLPPSPRSAQSLLDAHFAHLKSRHKGAPAGQSMSLPQLPWPSTGRVSTALSAAASGASTDPSSTTSAAESTDLSAATSAAASTFAT